MRKGHRGIRRRAALLAVLIGGLAVPASADANTITVSTDSDSLANNGACSLREAIYSANGDAASGAMLGECPAGSGPDTIVLPAGLFAVTRTGLDAPDGNFTGDFDVTADLTIIGAGAGTTTVSGGQHDRVFENFAPAKLRLEAITITGGHAPDGSDGGNVSGNSSQLNAPSGNRGEDGGGVLNHGELTLVQARVVANAAGAGGHGGDAIGTEAPSEANGVKAVAGQGAAGGSGGGIFNSAGAKLTVTDTTIAGNSAGTGGYGGQAVGGRGGAGTAAGNGGAATGGHGGAGGAGGGIGGDGTVTISGSTVSGNFAGNGGAGGAAGGGSGGNSGNWLGGAGARADAGDSGPGGAGGGVQSSAAVTITDSVVRDNAAGNGANGGNAVGGYGGNGGGSGSYAGGAGNQAHGGASGAGGDGGGVSAGAALQVERSSVIANRGGAAGNFAGNGNGGIGGNGGPPNGSGSSGNSGFGGNGGAAGAGAGLASSSSSSSPVVLNTTIAGNTSGFAGIAGAGTGGHGGNASGTGNAGGGGDGTGGNGGAGGTGAALRAAGSGTALTFVTATDNAPSSPRSGGPGNGGSPGSGGGFAFSGLGFSGSAGAPGVGGVAAAGGTLTDTILSGNAGNCSTALTNGSNNIVFGDTTCPGANVDPQLAALADHGGPGQTRAPQPGSPARDAISSGDASCTGTDERSVPRPQLGGCDIGAYEVAPPGATTGDATNVGTAGATLTGSVVPNAQATTFHFDYGATTDYGSSTPETSGDAAVSAAVAGLPAGTLIHYRLVAVNADGATTAADRTFSTGTPPQGAPGGGEATSDVVAPVLTSVSLSHTRFAVGPKSTALVAAKRRTPRGTVFRFGLSEAAKVRIAIQRALPGRRSGKRCIKPTRELRRARRCTRFAGLGTLLRNAHAGANRVAFTGRLGKRALRRGQYRAVLVATDAAGNRSKAVRRAFRIV
jgi:hypothetical protein